MRIIEIAIVFSKSLPVDWCTCWCRITSDAMVPAAPGEGSPLNDMWSASSGF